MIRCLSSQLWTDNRRSNTCKHAKDKANSHAGQPTVNTPITSCLFVGVAFSTHHIREECVRWWSSGNFGVRYVLTPKDLDYKP